MTFLPEPPWTVRRDELHLVEETYDALARRHESYEANDKLRDAECAVGQAFQELEREAEQTLTKRIGSDWLQNPDEHDHDHVHDHPHPPVRLRDQLHHDLQRDGVYVQALTWTQRVLAWGSAYERNHGRSSELLGIQLASCLVPMKISYAQGEMGIDDTFARDVAEKECELALAALGSARRMLLSYDTQAQSLSSEAQGIEAEIRQFVQHIRARE